MCEAGAELVVVQRFDEAFRSQTAEEFLERLGRGRDMAGMVMSAESAFGRDRQGTIATVRRLAARDGWQLVEVDTLEVDGQRVSSGRIRDLISAGDLFGAERLLGRGYAITGTATAGSDGWSSVAASAPFAMPPAGSYLVDLDAAGEARADIDGSGSIRVSSGQLGDGAVVRIQFLSGPLPA